MNRKRAILAAGILLLAILLAGCGGGQDTQAPAKPGNLSGAVLGAKGVTRRALPRLVGARVTLKPRGLTATVGEDGVFRFERIPPGAYHLTADAAGYVSYTLPGPVYVPAGGEGQAEIFLFPTPQGPPEAALSLVEEGPFPYNSTVELDASDSRNASRAGLAWEVLDERGKILPDPFSQADRPLQLANSSLPGASPFRFVFTPPAPGRYRVRLLSSNDLSPKTSVAEVMVKAVNTAPEAHPSITPGMESAASPAPTSGLQVVAAGENVYLRGWAVDVNAPSPELYNQGARTDAYGKNQDQLQRLFAWRWKLEYAAAAGGPWRDVTSSLQQAASQYPRFQAGQAGYYRASLVVSDQDAAGKLESSPSTLQVLAVAGKAEETSCAGCHNEQSAGWQRTAHAGKTGCQECHGPGQAHLTATPERKAATMGVTLRAGSCGRCHQEFAQWQKSRHSDGYAYGYAEIAPVLLLNCARCHYPGGYGEIVDRTRQEGKPFRQVVFKTAPFPGAPAVAPDLEKLPAQDGEGISCQACHDPHPAAGNPSALRAGSPGQACGTCHEEKWQNAILEGLAGEIQNGYEYPGGQYDRPNPHRTEDKCVLCHMRGEETKDASGVRQLAGHTLRMRDAGADGRLGGFGPAPDGGQRNPLDQDDVLNLAPCRQCHQDIREFNYQGTQERIYRKWQQLGGLLKQRNSGSLPGFKPGDKCATCHRGGTLPFDNDPDLVLENAYTNYKLVQNDRSWGTHNPAYTEKLLDDAIASVQRDYPLPGR